jgi:hypothetical protein
VSRRAATGGARSAPLFSLVGKLSQGQRPSFFIPLDGFLFSATGQEIYIIVLICVSTWGYGGVRVAHTQIPRVGPAERQRPLRIAKVEA